MADEKLLTPMYLRALSALCTTGSKMTFWLGEVEIELADVKELTRKVPVKKGTDGRMELATVHDLEFHFLPKNTILEEKAVDPPTEIPYKVAKLGTYERVPNQGDTI